MGVGEDDGYERKEFWSDCSRSIFYPSSSVKYLMMRMREVRLKGKEDFKSNLSTNTELY